MMYTSIYITYLYTNIYTCMYYLICTIIAHPEICTTYIPYIPRLHLQDDVAEMQRADVDLDEAQEHGADPDLETDEAVTPEAAPVASVTSLLSKPGREAEKAATPQKTQKHMEKHASKQKHIAGGSHEDKEQQKKVRIEKHVLPSSKKASHKDGANNSNGNSKSELKNSTKTGSEDLEKMGSNSINGSDVLGAGISPNSSFMGQNDTKIQSNTSAQSFPETGDAEIPNSTGATAATNAMPEANSQLKKVQERLFVEKMSSVFQLLANCF